MCQVRVFNDTEDQFSGPLFHVNYFALMDCNWYPRFVFAFLVMILVLFLKTTADEFLTGALTVICEILELSQDVAGATFLAFGNGAPDVFSTLAAFTKGSGGSNTDLGLGSLLGGISFVTTVVLGSVILSTMEEIPVMFETFGRDLLFLIVAVLWIAALHLFGGGASIWVGIFFLALYGCYVVLVIYQSRMIRMQKCWNDDPDADEPLISLINVTSDVEQEQQQQLQKSKLMTSATTTNDVDARHEEEGSEEHRYVAAPLVITDDYFPRPSTNRPSTTASPPLESTPYAQESNSPPTTCASKLARWAVFQDLYWRQLRMRQRAVRYGARVATDLTEMGFFERMLSVIQIPLAFLRALTVPLPEPASWSKNLIVMHPPCCVTFFLYIAFQDEPVLPVLMGILLPASLLLSVVLFFRLHDSRPPSSKSARLLFAMISFVMCVMWIYAVAAEIVALFNSFGTVFGANSSIMGLSFLAWGNSIGDLVTNVAIARGGMPAMGVAACVASPVFNTLFGLGASLTVVAGKQYPQHVPISLDRFTIAAVILLLTVLGLTLMFARIRKYKLNRAFGIFLVSAYGIYLAVMGILSLLHL